MKFLAPLEDLDCNVSMAFGRTTPIGPPDGVVDGAAAQLAVDGSRNASRQMSTKGKSTSAESALARADVAWLHVASMAAVFEITGTEFVFFGEPIDLRYGTKPFEMTFLIWSGVGLAVAGHDASSTEANSLETTVSIGGC